MGFWSDAGNWLFGDDKSEVRDPRMMQGKRLRGMVDNQLAGVQDREAPQAGGTQINMGPQGQFRQQQMELADRLGKISSGQEQGAGELAVQRQGARAMAGQQAMARMGRGSDAAGAARTAARNTAALGTNIAGQAQQAGLADRLQADQTLMGTLSSGRGMDAQLATAQGGMDQQTQLANLDAMLTARGMDDAAKQAYLGQLIQMDQAEMAARLQRDLGTYDPHGMFGALAGAGAQVGAAAASDRRAKTEIEGAELDELLDNVKAFTYRYKDPEAHGKGRKHGVMAQDLEKTSAGHSWVKEGEDGTKMVDYGQAASTILAAAVELNKRVKA